jgi:hypothetical protein
MTEPRSPQVDPRRATEFAAELRARARAWIPRWELDANERDFGAALLEIAARYNAEVAERLDKAGDKMRRGFLDWLGMRGMAARPARMPVVFTLSADAREAVLASAPVVMQADAGGVPVVFETERDLRIMPGAIASLVGADPAHDAFYFPPPGLSDLKPLEPLPLRWQFKSFAAAGARTIQLDPALGLSAGDLIAIDGAHYRVVDDPSAGLVAIDPPLDADAVVQTVVSKESVFAPFDGAARNRQNHALYLGDADLLNIASAATIDITGAGALGSGVTWEIWGKSPAGDDPAWQPLKLTQTAAGLGIARLEKLAGSVEPFELEGRSGRWIRARRSTVAAASSPVVADQLGVRVNAQACATASGAAAPNAAGATTPIIDAFTNTTQLDVQSQFYPLGKEPKQFDAFYLGSEEAFSKRGAQVSLQFEMADRTFNSLSALQVARLSRQQIFVGIANDRALHLLELDAATGKFTKFDGLEPQRPTLTPPSGDSRSRTQIQLDPSPTWRIPVYLDPISGGELRVIVSAGDSIWQWQQPNRILTNEAKWVKLPTPQTESTSSSRNERGFDGIIYLAGTQRHLVAVFRKKLFKLALDVPELKWILCSRVTFDTITQVQPLLSNVATDEIIGITTDGRLYLVDVKNGQTTALTSADSLKASSRIQPCSWRIGNRLVVVSASAESEAKLLVATLSSSDKPPSLKSLNATGPIRGVHFVQSDDHVCAVTTIVNGSLGDLNFFCIGKDHDDYHPIVGKHFQAGLNGVPTITSDDKHARVIVPGQGATIYSATLPTEEGTPQWRVDRGDTSTNPELAWEYWNGKGWWRLPVTDTTRHLKVSGSIAFDTPDDLAPSDWSGKSNHWIRARLIGGDYGREIVYIVKDDKDRQYVERDTSQIRAPLAFPLKVNYAVCTAATPQHVIAYDNGAYHDQSDANRTPGAIVEAFVPLAHALGTNGGGTPGRALYVGLDGAIAGSGVNLLFLADEREHAAFEPLRIETLVNGRFMPLPAHDATRALSEPGLLSLSFSAAPTPAELFGTVASWIRLTPAPGASAQDWKPALLGAYLNGAWASATESLTRELLGSSDGAPNLTVRLARPPVLHNSLELRVREPLGEEERSALRATGPNRVLSDIDGLPGDWVLWTQVVDPADADPGARVYALDEASGQIRFGNGLHGAIPPIARDAIVAFRYQRTEPDTDPAGDAPANAIAARTSLNMVSPLALVESATAALQAAGGAQPESAERVARFGHARLRHRGRAITARDFEDLALASSTDIVQARASAHQGRVRLVIVMRGATPHPRAEQLRALRRVLLEATPPALRAPGALRIAGPRPRALHITLTLGIAALDQAAALEARARAALAAFFDPSLGGPSGDGWRLGVSPTEDDIACALLGAPGLAFIERVVLNETGDDDAQLPWPARLRPHELAVLAADALRITFVVAEGHP